MAIVIQSGKTMGFVPIFMDAAELPVAVIGGDDLATQRVRSLIEAGARVTVVNPTLSAGLGALVAEGRVRHLPRNLGTGDLRGFALAYCTTDDPDRARAAVAEAEARGVPINVTDQPQLCRFIVPAIGQRGELQIAVSTSGVSPALARLLREELEDVFGPEYLDLLALMRAVRSYLRRHYADAAHRRVLAATLARDLRAAVLRRDRDATDEVVRRHLGVALDQLVDTVAMANERAALPSRVVVE